MFLNNLNLIAPISGTGYGIASINILASLRNAGVGVSLFPVNPNRMDADEKYHEHIRAGMNEATHFNVGAACLRIWHQFDMAQFVGRGPHIGYPIFELDRFTHQEIHHLSSLDHIFVCSKWAEQIIRDNGINVHTSVIPLGVDMDTFFPLHGQQKSGPTIFLNIGKWEIRKGHDVLLPAFERAVELAKHTTGNADMELWLVCNNPFYSEAENKEWENYFLKSAVGDKIKIIPRLSQSSQVARLMQQADCGIFPARAEGWNLELLEMMACGKNVITTNFSGHTEFVNHDNAMLVDIDELEPAHDGKWFNGQGNWAKIDDNAIDHFASFIDLIHQKKQNESLSPNLVGWATAKMFTWDNTVKEIISHVDDTR